MKKPVVFLTAALLAVLLLVLAGLLLLRQRETGQTAEADVTETAAEDLRADAADADTDDADTDDADTDDADTDDEDSGGLLYFDESWYAPREELETVLIIGADDYEPGGSEDGDTGSAEADFLLLLVLDPEAGTTQAIHLNRDTMTEITIPAGTGAEAGTFTGRLALAYTGGSDSTDSCENTMQAVSGLLNGIEIDHYASVTMNGVAVLNDLVGGVTLEVLDDFTGIDSTLVQGETVTLQGEQALTYVRTGTGQDESAALARMERQRQYLAALQDQAAACAAQDAGFILAAVIEVSAYLTSDCSIEELSEIGTALLEQPVETYCTLEGEAVQKETYMEYYVDADALQELVLELFYEPVQAD